VLKGIHPLLTPDLLKLLAEMGHGDEIVLADSNFTAYTLAAGKPVVHLSGVGMCAACAAVLSVFPLDAMVAMPIAYMHVGDAPAGYRSALQREVIAAIEAQAATRPEQYEAMERFSFYERVRGAYAIVQTGETQPWANFLFKKGVIAEALRP
jgi:L-fucose mutarotase